MNDKKEPAFIEFDAPTTDLNDLQFTIESDNETPTFEPETNSVNKTDNTEIFNFETPETIPEFNIDENIFETPNEKLDITQIEENLADEFIKNNSNNPDFKIPENTENKEIFASAITELENKIDSTTTQQQPKTSFLKRFNFKNMFQNKKT